MVNDQAAIFTQSVTKIANLWSP